MKSSKKNNKEFIFKRSNYLIMIVGIIFIGLGFLLMSGGGSDDPNIFSTEIYNFRRIRLAPSLVLIGFGIQVYAILYKGKK